MKKRGFTLVELIMTLVLVGVLAVAVLPRMFNLRDHQNRALFDDTLAALRYAQKSAVAQRRMVCVVFTGNSATLQIASNPSPATCGFGALGGSTVALLNPNGGNQFVVSGRGGAAYAAVPANLGFNALGQPLDAAGNVLAIARTIGITSIGASITIEPETGYVHP